MSYSEIVAHHREYFLTGITRTAEWRESQFTSLREMLLAHTNEISEALWKDLRRNRFEAEVGEVLFVADEALHARKHLRSWMKPQEVKKPLLFTPGKAQVHHDPLGVCLIIGAWNYPLMLSLSPLVAAIAGGNVAIIKPSEKAPATAQVIATILPKYLDNDAFSVVCGGESVATELLEQKWDHIFFTGNALVGKSVMQAAAKNLTPVVLELGGKNPAIVHSSANLPVAARRIAQGRWMNAGQSCTAPDYVLVFKESKDHLLEELSESVLHFYGRNPQRSPDYGRIINVDHFDRLTPLLKNGDIYHGGHYDRNDLYIEPTILVNVQRDLPIMREEIFGPILPVIEIESIEEAFFYINAKPLALYLFSEEETLNKRVINESESGSVVINDCAIHPLVRDLPFGGLGHSGMGKYHGEWGFREYTHARGILRHSSLIDLDIRYPPYSRYEKLRSLAWKLLSR